VNKMMNLPQNMFLNQANSYHLLEGNAEVSVPNSETGFCKWKYSTCLSHLKFRFKNQIERPAARLHDQRMQNVTRSDKR
jgi:hypothetical protein